MWIHNNNRSLQETEPNRICSLKRAVVLSRNEKLYTHCSPRHMTENDCFSHTGHVQSCGRNFHTGLLYMVDQPRGLWLTVDWNCFLRPLFKPKSVPSIYIINYFIVHRSQRIKSWNPVKLWHHHHERNRATSPDYVSHTFEMIVIDGQIWPITDKRGTSYWFTFLSVNSGLTNWPIEDRHEAIGAGSTVL